MAKKPTFEELEQRIQELERKVEIFQPTSENVDVGITKIKSNFEIEWANPVILNWFGTSLDELVGRKCYEAFEHKDDICGYCPAVKAMETGQPVEAEAISIKSDGTRFFVRDKVFPLYNEDGETIGFNEIVENITERKQAEEALREVHASIERLVEERTTELMESNQKMKQEMGVREQAEEALRESEKRLKESQKIARLGQWELDLSTNTLYWSEGIYDLFKIDSNKFMASYKTFLDAIHPDDREFVDNEDEFELEVSDNGIGIPEDLDFRDTETLGLHLVKILVALSTGDAGHPLIKFLNPLAYTRFLRASRTSL